MKNKKALYITLIALDVAITIALLVISIIMLVRTSTMTRPEIVNAKGFIGYLQNHPLVYGLAFVVPLFILLAVNIIALYIYVKKTSKKAEVSVSDLTDEQKEALRQELLNDLQNGK